MTNLIAKFLMTTILLGTVSTFSLAADFSAEAATWGDYRVEAYQTQIHQYYLKAGTNVDIDLFGDGYSNLDLYVYDYYGNLVISKAGSSDVETAKLTINRSEYFTVKIVNRGNTYNRFNLRVWQF